jgi:uncharacterized protein
MDAERARARDMLDLEEGHAPVRILSGMAPATLLGQAKRIAIVGASPSPERPSNGVMEYLMSQGYECVPINPNAESVLGVGCFATLEDAVAAGGPFDIVDAFRRSEAVEPIARSAVATGARALWMQLGVVNWEAARIADDAGLAVVMDRCTAIEHRRLRGA